MQIVLKVLKAILGVVAVLVILMLLAFWTINLVNWDKHKGVLISAVERFTDFRVDELEGVRIKLLRHADARVARVKIHNEDPGSPLKSFESQAVHLRIPVFPLFKKELIVDAFTLDGGRLNLREGTPEEAEQKEEEGGGLEKLPSIFVNLARISDSQFRYEPGKKGSEAIAFVIEDFLLSAPGERLPTIVNGAGRFEELPVTISGETISFDDFRRADALPAWLRATMGQHTVDVRGSLRTADASARLLVDANGPNIEDLKKILRLNIGAVPAYKLSFVTQAQPSRFNFSDIDLRLGKSSLLGSAGIDLSGAKPKISAKLESPTLVHADLSPIFQTDSRYKDETEPPKAPGQYFSDKPIEAAFLKDIDADVTYQVVTFKGAKAGLAVQGGYARLVLKNGNLMVEPLVFNASAGTIGGNFRFDASRKPYAVTIGLRAERVDLKDLLGPVATEVPVVKLKPTEMARGILSGHLDLKMHGNTPMELAKSIQGPIALVVDDGALSGTVIEAFGIDISETIASWFRGHPLYEMKCMLTSFEAKDGAIGTKAFLISTKDTSIIGKGGINLVGNKVDYTLNAHPHDFSIGSIRSPIEIKGPLNDIDVGLKKEELSVRSGIAVALGALVNPLLALLPLTEPGLDKKGQCKDIVDELQVAHERSKTPPSRTVVR